ncbi:DUF4760 domain-containing protein, partial [Ralstonia nicotianae]
YLFMRRHIFPAVLIIAALAAGILIGAHWTTLRCYVVRVGIGASMLKFAPVAGPTLGIIVFLWQISRARYNQRIDLILKLAERFEKSELRAARAKAARSLLPNRKADNAAIGELLSFFEEVGFLLQRRAIDIDAAYEFFEYWAIPYCQVTEQYRQQERAIYPDLYSHVERLVAALRYLELGRSGKSPDRSNDELHAFLVEESRLVPPATAKTLAFGNGGQRYRRP